MPIYIQLYLYLQVGFGIDLNAVEDANSPFPTAVRNVLEGIESGLRDPLWMIKFWTFRYQNKITKSIRYVRQYFQSVIEDRIAQRKNEHKDILHGKD